MTPHDMVAGISAVLLALSPGGFADNTAPATSSSIDGKSPVSAARSSGHLAMLRVTNVRIEAPSEPEAVPSAVLRFDVLNEGPIRLDDIVLEIAIVEKPDATHRGGTSPRVLVAPFAIAGGLVIESGYTVSYEMLFQNLSSDCHCVAHVHVLSVGPQLAPLP